MPGPDVETIAHLPSSLPTFLEHFGILASNQELC